MKNLKLIFIAVITLLLFVLSCRKYEDGPAVSLKTKKARITGEWQLKSVTDTYGTKDYVSPGGVSQFNFKKDGTGTVTKRSCGGESAINISWDFVNDKEEIEIKYLYNLDSLNFDYELNGANVTVDYITEEKFVIKKLKNSELWIECDTYSDKELCKFKKK